MRIKIVIFALCVAYGASHAARADNPLPGNFVGGNLTSFSEYPGSVNNNQYNQMMNPDRGAAAAGGATADFGNCNALIQRCAAPKCAGCGDMSIAVPIVAGCVQATSECRKHGDALTQAIAAQIVSQNQAKANAAAQQQAAAQAAAAQAQSAQQIQAVQDQMAQMQQQMAAQQAESAAQMQQALAAQQQAAEAAMAQQAAQLAQQQQPAAAIAAAPATQQQVDMGVSADVIARQQIVGQVMSSLDGVDSSMQTLKKVLNDALDYAKCDRNANSCEGPKRVAAFKAKAQAFVEPYDNVTMALEKALLMAQASGVDLSEIYMMLSGACGQWAQFMCNSKYDDAVVYCKTGDAPNWNNRKTANESGTSVFDNCYLSKTDTHTIQHRNPSCTFMKNLDDKEEIQQNWLSQSMDAGDKLEATRIKIACVSDGVLQIALFKRNNRKRETSGLDMDIFEYLVDYDEPKTKTNRSSGDMSPFTDNQIGYYCWPNDVTTMEKVIRDIKNGKFSEKYTRPEDMDWDGSCASGKECFGLCSTHAYNLSKAQNPSNADAKKDMDALIALKATAFAQIMKRNYTMLETSVQQIRTQLQKAVMATAAEAAGAARESSGSSSSSVAGADCVGKGRAEVISCVDRIMSTLRSMPALDFRKSCENIVTAMNGFLEDSEKKKEKLDLNNCQNAASAARNTVIAEITGALQKLRDKETEMNRMGGYRN